MTVFKSTIITLLALLGLSIAAELVDDCPNADRSYDFILQYTVDDESDGPIAIQDMDCDRNTREYREQAYGWFREQYGIVFDVDDEDVQYPYVEDKYGFQVPVDGTHFIWENSPETRFHVYAIHATGFPRYEGLFPIDNAEFKDDGYMLVLNSDTTVYGKVGGEKGTVVPAGSFILFGEYRLFIDGVYSGQTFQYESNAPVVPAPFTGLIPVSCEIHNPLFGDGITRGAAEIIPVGFDGDRQARIRTHTRYTMTLPQFRFENMHHEDQRCVKAPQFVPPQ